MKDIIKNYREQKGWTQAQLAEKLHMTPQAVSNYESGIRVPEFETLRKLSRLLGFSLDQTLGEEAEMEKQKDLFTIEEFKRFCVQWEWRQGAMDLDLSVFKQDKDDSWVYDLFPWAEYRLRLYRGNITMETKSNDPYIIEAFQEYYDQFVQKKLHGKPMEYIMTGVDPYDDESFTFKLMLTDMEEKEELIAWANHTAMEMGLYELDFYDSFEEVS